tara:strand:+ start:572 stop:1681 length:1110 start_codon:yes stop_codon:yes gene_type:complete
MRIGLNATCFNSRPSGAKQRFLGIYPRLVKKLKFHNFFIFHSKDYNLKKDFGIFDNVKFVKVNIPSENSIKKNLIYLFYFKKLISNYKLDLIEVFNLPAFLPANLKYLLTIHDIRNNYFKYSGISKLLAIPILKYFLKNSYKIITVSNTMKNEINKFYKNSKTLVVHNGIETKYTKHYLKKTNKKRYLLSVGHFEKRKNFIKLIQAFSIFNKINDNFKLIIVGNAHSPNEKKYLLKIKSLIKDESLEGSIKILNNVKQKKLENLYYECSFFITSSFYEGFGITILEAMRSKKIILASNLKVFREISPKGIIFFDNQNIESIFKSINFTVSRNLKFNKKIAYNTKRIKKFEFDNVVDQLKNIYIKKLTIF